MVMQIDDRRSLVLEHRLVEIVVGCRGDVRCGIGIWVTEGGLGARQGRAFEGSTCPIGGLVALLGSSGGFVLGALGSGKGGVAAGLEFLGRRRLGLVGGDGLGRGLGARHGGRGREARVAADVCRLGAQPQRARGAA
jgi:hypothetical protein